MPQGVPPAKATDGGCGEVLAWIFPLFIFLEPPAFNAERRIELEQNDFSFLGSVRDAYVDARGHIFVADSKLAEIKMYDGDGHYLKTLAGRGDGPGQVQLPVSIAGDREFLYSADVKRGVLNLYGASDHEFKKACPLIDAKKVRVSGSNLAVAALNLERNESIQFLSEDCAVHRGLLPIPAICLDSMLVSSGMMLDFDRVGNLYGIHEMEYRIHQFSPDGTWTAAFPGSNPHYESPQNHPVVTTFSKKRLLEWLFSWTHVLNLVVAKPFDQIWVQLKNFGPDEGFIDIYATGGQLIVGAIRTDLRLLCSDPEGWVVALHDRIAEEEERFVIERIRLTSP